MNEELLHCLALKEVKAIGSVLAKRLIERFGSAKGVFLAQPDELLSVEGITLDKVRNIKSFSNWQGVERLFKKCEKEGIKIYSLMDFEYPTLLKQISDPPLVLFCKGEILPQDHFGIAVVGSRKPTEYGVRVTDTIVTKIASYGITVVSGLARGIDSIAHTAALKAEGRTIAVLGSGLLYIYPRENKYLAEKILKQGAILSEFYPEEKPSRENFPRRNRIISGMSIATLVTEAGANSGALITASFAADQGRDVFAVPGNITSENSKGTNFLIKRGAKLIQTVEDILEEIKQFIPSLKEAIIKDGENLIKLKEEQKAIFDILKEPLTVDEIVFKTGKTVSEVLTNLLNLEIEGLVVKIEGKYVRRIHETS